MWTSLLALALAASSPEPPGVLLGKAQAQARLGDFTGMRHFAEDALAQPGDHQRQAQLLIGVSMELDGDLFGALAIYESLADAYRRRDVPEAITLRLAITRAALGRHREARRTLRPLRRDPTPQRALQIDVLLGMWDIEAGRDARGLRSIDDALDRDTPSPWWRAQGHNALAVYALAQARRLPTPVDAADLEQTLATQAELVAMAQEQVSRVLRVKEFALGEEGLLDVVATLEIIATTLAQTPFLDEAERQHRVEGVLLKALTHVLRAITVAQLRQADAAHLDALERTRSRLQTWLESVSTPS